MLKSTLLTAALIAGLVPMAAAQLSPADKTFVTKTAKSNSYEIKAAQMAQQMSKNPAYKTFAQMIIDDHTQAGQQLTQAVQSADPSMQLPTGVSAGSQAKLDTLKNAGGQFDIKYRDQMIATHQSALNLVKTYLQHVHDNPGIKQFAQTLQPVLAKHWDYAKKLPKQ